MLITRQLYGLMTNKFNMGFMKWLLKWQTSAFWIVEIILSVVICFSLCVAIFRYQKTVFIMNEPKITKKNNVDAFDKGLTQESKPLTFYLDLLGARDIFHLGSMQPIFSSIPTGNTTSAGIDFTTRYIVQGIILDKNPQAIIQDTQSMKTFFLHRKDLLDKATLVDIRGNQVIFNLDGQTVELIKK